MKKLDLETGFTNIDMRNMGAEQIASFLTPYIELAGFTWVIVGTELRIFKDNDKA